MRSPVVSVPTLTALRLVGRPVATVLMMHRFRDPQLGNEGDDVTGLRAVLQLYRRQRVRVLSLTDLLRHVAEREPLAGPTVVLTLDDGYLDFGSVAAPVLAEFDCPVTVFVTTEVASGKLWFWWDQIEHAFPHEFAESFLGDALTIDHAPFSDGMEHDVCVRDVRPHGIRSDFGSADAGEDIANLWKIAAQDGL